MKHLRDTILELMSVPEEQCDLNWLKKALQTAIKLEFSTIPPYLCALWSIDDIDSNGPVAQSIQTQIAREEMLHFAIACNLLVAIGGTPVLNTSEGVPTYPGPLPGIDNPDLIISLRGLSPSAIQVFLEVEYPEFNPIVTVGEKPVSTIGAFYNRICMEFESLESSGNLKIQEALQLDMTSTGYFTKSYIVKDIVDVKAAIGTIQLQGEGSASSPEEGAKDLAHYYRFAEIFEGQKLVFNKETKQWTFEGGPMPFPKVSPMAKVPAGGYRKEQVSAEIGENLEKFDRGFTQMMNQLQEAWTPDPKTGKANPAALNESINTMRTLREFAKILINTPVIDKDTSGNYGPCFRIV